MNFSNFFTNFFPVFFALFQDTFNFIFSLFSINSIGVMLISSLVGFALFWVKLIISFIIEGK